MLRLALLRHAKSSWDDPRRLDFDRPLNARGKSAAPVMGAVIASLKLAPDAILCSPAARTRETLDLVMPSLNAPVTRVLYPQALYHATPDDLLAAVRDVPAETRCILLVGHNPGLHELAHRLATDGAPTDLNRLTDRYPTAALAVLTFPAATFRDLDPDTGTLAAFITPKDRA